jgi:hypothetical protein
MVPSPSKKYHKAFLWNAQANTKNFYPHRVPLERNSQRRVSNGKKEGEKRVIG